MNICLFKRNDDNAWLKDHLKGSFPSYSFNIVNVQSNIPSNYAFELLKQLKENKGKVDLFVIPSFLSDNYLDFYGLELAFFIRLTFEFEDYATKPIIIFGSETEAELRDLSNYSLILNTPSIYYSQLSLEAISHQLNNIINVLKEKIISSISNIKLDKPETKGHHSLSNRWAVFRIAERLDCLKTIQKNTNINRILESPYYRHLLYQNHYSVKNNSLPFQNFVFNDYKIPASKFLLIDDNYDQGWNKLLSVTLDKLNTQNKLTSITHFKDYSEIENQVIQLLDKDEFDLIFLDLRLLEKEQEMNLNNISSIMDFSGAKLLEKIKDKFPYMPVIILTASQQAWNNDQLYNIGSDSYFIKESAESPFSNEILDFNITRLFQDIYRLVITGKDLRWFYLNTLKIEKSIENQKYNTNIKKRITQKLNLSFGILRSRRSDYDKKFAYSDYQLAFLIYWSILIEFQYERISNEEYDGKKDEFYFKDGHKYIFNNKSPIERYYDKFPSSNAKWYNKFKKDLPKYRLISDEKDYIDFSLEKYKKLKYTYKNLSSLIPAYILLKFGPSYDWLIDDFVYLNENRNTLDYTHSDKNTVFNQEIRTNKNEEEDLMLCKDMFKFLFHLLTDGTIDNFN